MHLSDFVVPSPPFTGNHLNRGFPESKATGRRTGGADGGRGLAGGVQCIVASEAVLGGTFAMGHVLGHAERRSVKGRAGK